MSKYYFHLRDGRDVLLDPEGRDIADPATIPGLTLKDARSIISQDVLGGRIHLEQSIEVIDEAGRIVHRLDFRDAVIIDG